jgi:hypothetical protein
MLALAHNTEQKQSKKKKKLICVYSSIHLNIPLYPPMVRGRKKQEINYFTAFNNKNLQIFTDFLQSILNNTACQ